MRSARRPRWKADDSGADADTRVRARRPESPYNVLTMSPPSPLFGQRLAGRRPLAVAAVLVAVVAAYVMGSMPGRGVYWDEEAQSRHGQDVLRWYASGFQDRSALEQWNLILYGGTVETALELAASVTPERRYVVRHVGVALFGLAALVGVFRLGVGLGVPWAGVLGALLLSLHPRFLGHMFFNSKDIPFAALYVWVLVLLARDLRRPDGARLRSTLPLGVCLGTLLGTRVGGAIVLAPILLGYAVRWWETGRDRITALRLLARFSAICLTAYPVMLVAWPWAQERPLVHPLVALLASGRFPFEFLQLFNGEFVGSLHLPLSYVPTWLLVTTPEVILLGLVALVGVSMARPGRLRALRDPAAAAVTVAGVLPLVYVIATRAALYDGPRHLLFTQPFLALASALGLILVLREIAARVRPWAAGVAAAGVALTCALPLKAILILRPYEYVYFNDASGGLPAADGRFELDYWGLSYREGMEWLSRNLPPAGRHRVASCSNPESSRPFVGGSVEYVGSTLYSISQPADVLVYAAPQDCMPSPPWTPPPGRILYRVERQGVSLLTVLEPDRPFVPDWECDGCRPPAPRLSSRHREMRKGPRPRDPVGWRSAHWPWSEPAALHAMDRPAGGGSAQRPGRSLRIGRTPLAEQIGREVPVATVADHEHDHPMLEVRGHLERCRERTTAARARQDPLLARQLPGHAACILLADVHDPVHPRRLEDRGHHVL